MGRWQGQEDPPLTAAGERQAAVAAARLGAVDAVWSSPLERAWRTAEIIAESLGVGPVLCDERLQETYFGPWQGLTMPEVEAGWPGYLATHRRPDGAESWDDVTSRATAALVDIATAHAGGDVLVVTHAGVIRTLRRVLVGDDRRYANLAGHWLHVTAAGDLVPGDELELVDPDVGSDAL